MRAVLVVDRDLDTREAAGEILENEGIPVLLAEDGETALQHLEREPRPGLVLLDSGAALKDGDTVLDWIARRDDLRGLPVVLLADTSMPSAPRVAAFLQKPFGLGELLRAVHQFLR